MHTISDESLRTIRAGLLEREDQLNDRVHRVQGEIGERDPRLPVLEDATRRELRQIEGALERVEAGTYGLCEECGHRIDAARMRAAPYAVRCERCEADG